jgi:ABC-2 type transport system ATP-binding protein
VIVLDEPTAGVDVELRKQLWEYVRSLHAQGTTIVLTTHYLEEAQELCDTIAIINHGNVIACEPTPNLIGRLDRKTLLVTPRDAISLPLQGFEDVTFGMRPSGALALTYKTSEHSVEEMLDRVRRAGIAIKDLSIEEPDLEDVFVEMTTTA